MTSNLFHASRSAAAFCLIALATGVPAANAAQPALTTTAKVEVQDEHGKIPLKHEEQIAVMFLSAISNMESDCVMHMNAACSLDQLVKGPQPPDHVLLGKLKYDPNAADPNYQYTVTAVGKSWTARANPRHLGLAGFYSISQKGNFQDDYYNPAGPIGTGDSDRQLMGTSISGDSFVAH